MTNKIRFAVASLVVSAGAFVGILTREGWSDTAIIPTKGDVPTLGFGTTGDVKMGDRITPVLAVQRAYKDVTTYEGAIKRCVKVPLQQAEYDVYVDMVYNIGPTAFCNSTMVRKLNVQDYNGACNAILRFNKVSLPNGKLFDCSTPGNRICAGLWTDRLRVHALCAAAQ